MGLIATRTSSCSAFLQKCALWHHSKKSHSWIHVKTAITRWPDSWLKTWRAGDVGISRVSLHTRWEFNLPAFTICHSSARLWKGPIHCCFIPQVLHTGIAGSGEQRCIFKCGEGDRMQHKGYKRHTWQGGRLRKALDGPWHPGLPSCQRGTSALATSGEPANNYKVCSTTSSCPFSFVFHGVRKHNSSNNHSFNPKM